MYLLTILLYLVYNIYCVFYTGVVEGLITPNMMRIVLTSDKVNK